MLTIFHCVAYEVLKKLLQLPSEAPYNRQLSHINDSASFFNIQIKIFKGLLSIAITVAAIGLLIWGGMKVLGNDTKRIR